MNPQRILLPSKESQNSIDENLHLKIEIPHTNKHLPISELESVVDIGKVFSKERDLSNCYRFLGNINIVASNVLFNWSGDTSYQNILELMDYDDDTEQYVKSQSDVLLETDGWFYYQTGTTNCQKTFLEPTQDRFSIYDLSGNTNWNLWITYPSKENLYSLEFYGVPLTDGLAIFSAQTVTIDDRVMTAFICPIRHGLTQGDTITLTGATTGYEGNFSVYTLGLQDGTNLDNIFVIDIDLGVPPALSSSGLYFYRTFNGVRSIYSSRWFKRCSGDFDYEFYNNAFAENIYADQIWAYNYNNPIDVGQLFDYLDRPVTELYLTIVKKQDNTSGYPFWTQVQSGIESYVQLSNYDIRAIHTKSTSTVPEIESDVNNNSEYLFGDIIEYNPLQQYENILCEARHRFNTNNREDSNFLEGYFYKPHHKMQIRKFSDYVLTSLVGDIDAPYYAVDMGNGTIAWREILSNNFTNGETIPFLNGCHYIYKLTDLFIRRQDPCWDYQIGNKSFVQGKCNSLEDFVQVNVENLCEG